MWTKWKWTLGRGFQYGGQKWRLYNIETTDVGQWKRGTDGRSWGQNNIDFIISNDEQMLNNNCRSDELVFFNEMDHGVYNEESMIQKSKIGVSMVSTNSPNAFA